MRRLLAVSLALLLGLTSVAQAADLEPGYAADLEPVYKAPVYKAPVEEPPLVVPFLVLPLIGLVVACVTVICKEEKPPPKTSPAT